MHSLQKFFEPESIAVIGASRDKTKLGRMVLDNIINGGYQGKVYPINPKAGDISGLQTYADVEQIPYFVDLAVIVIPSKFVVQTIKQCANKGVKGAVIITAGFGETGEEGRVWEDQIREIARASKMRILGPNCLGFINPKIKLNASFSKNTPKPGNVGFLSQSGAFGTAILDWADGSEIGFDLFVSIGNKLDINESDLLEYWNEVGVPQVVVSYLEDIRDGRKFNELNSTLTKNAPHIILKPGKTEAAKKAIQSHTGALAGSDLVVSTALKQFGCLRADGMHDLFDMIRAFALQPLPKGNRIAIVTNAGGPAVMTTDFIEEHGMKVARFEKRTTEILKEKLPRTANIHDPVDVIGDALADRYAAAIDATLGDPNVDALIVLLTPQVMTQIEETALYIGRLSKTHGKTVAAAFVGGRYVESGRDKLEELGVPVYHYPDRAVLAIKAMNEYRQYLEFEKSKESLDGGGEIIAIDVTKRMQVEQVFQRALIGQRKAFTPEESLEIVRAYGMKTPPSKAVINEEEAVQIAEEFGYPVVMKISSDKLLHKTELGGVELNIDTPEKVRETFRRLQGTLASALGRSVDQISGGVEVQKQIFGGQEVMIGVKKDKNFGHLILFGMGGIYTEVYKDFATRLAPLSMEDAKQLIRETKTFKILSGYRNLPKRDVASIAEYILITSRLVTDFPVISELDVNPLIVLDKGKGCFAVDVKIVIS